MHVQNRCLIADISCNIHVKDYQLQNTITNFLSVSYLTMWSFKVRAVTSEFLQISLRNDSANYLIMINQKQYLMKNAILLFTVLLIKEKSTYIDFTNDNRTLCFNTCPKSEKYNSNQHDVS